jgi:hypothetical protein
LYRLATPNKYDFAYLDLQSNPPLFYSNFDKVVGVGGFKSDDEMKIDNDNS